MALSFRRKPISANLSCSSPVKGREKCAGTLKLALMGESRNLVFSVNWTPAFAGVTDLIRGSLRIEQRLRQFSVDLQVFHQNGFDDVILLIAADHLDWEPARGIPPPLVAGQGVNRNPPR